MTLVSRSTIHSVSLAGQGMLIVLCLGWALFERPAPFINVLWRGGLSAEARRMTEAQLHLENGELSGEEWRYELASPRTTDIAAIVSHPDVQDTHRIDRRTATISADAGRGTLRVWWVGPFKGARSRLQFRIVFAVIGLVTLWCSSIANSRRRPFALRPSVRGQKGAGRCPMGA